MRAYGTFELQVIKRKRAVREDVVRARAARRIVLPINRQITVWQSDAARLRAMSARFDPPANAILTEIDRLEAHVISNVEDLSAVLETTPTTAIEQGRVLDTVKALRSLGSSLHQIRDTLRVAGPRLDGHPQTLPASAVH